MLKILHMHFGRKRDAEGITEQEARERILDGQRFFERHPKILSPSALRALKPQEVLFVEADKIRKSLSDACKSLIADGGKVPAIIDDCEKLLELFGLLLKPDHTEFYSTHQVLSSAKILPPIEAQQGIRFVGALALRAVLIRRRIAKSPGSYPEVENLQLVTMNDVVHVLFDLVDGAYSEAPKDLGWVLLNGTTEEARAYARRGYSEKKRVEGGVWRQYRMGEIARREARKDPGLNGLPSRSLTLVSEMRNDTGLRGGQGEKPSFFRRKIEFGHADVLRELSPSASESLRFQIRRQIESCMKSEIAEMVHRELAMTAGDIPPDDFIRGGRRGLNPSELYWRV